MNIIHEHLLYNDVLDDLHNGKVRKQYTFVGAAVLVLAVLGTTALAIVVLYFVYLLFAAL